MWLNTGLKVKCKIQEGAATLTHAHRGYDDIDMQPKETVID